MVKLNLFLTVLIGFVLIVPSAEAKRKRSGKSGKKKYSEVNLCGNKTATTTVYNLPKEDKKETWKGFKTFQDSVKMQGSGRRTNGNIARYKGPDVKTRSSCNTTTTSASGKCLMSYFSVAADPKYYKMGDIIYMRSLDKDIKLPNGRTVRHPGFLIVQDVGGAIKGPNRFDFFVGPIDATASSFKDPKIADKKSCENKGFEKLERGSGKYNDALAQIHNNQDSDTSVGNQPGGGGATQAVASK